MHIPIIFSIDENVVMQCGVTITSLLSNSGEDTFYDIFILYNTKSLSQDSRDQLIEAFRDMTNCSIGFVDVGKRLESVCVSNSDYLTSATYYRLAIPELFPQYDKVIYADIDMIFQQDLSHLYVHALLDGELVAAVPDLAINDQFYFHSSLPQKVGKSEKDYFNAGFLVMNLALMRDQAIMDAFQEHSKKGYDQNDQDVLNIVCNGRVQFLPSIYNFQLNHFSNYMWGRENVDISFDELFKKATLHYTWKHKPWNSLECVGYDTWWHYYKMSPFYDDKVYFKRQYDQIEASRNDYHNLSNSHLFRRILVNLKHRLFG